MINRKSSNLVIYCIFLLFASFSIFFKVITLNLGIIQYISGIFLLTLYFLYVTRERSTLYKEYYFYFLLIGILCRILLSFSVPLWEDDWARYLWEGNLIREGISPYTTRPESFFADSKFLIIGEKESEILSRINHPDWSSIYSPLVLLYFYFVSLLTPFSLEILKLGYIGMDLLVVWMISKLRNKQSAISYFLFPVVLKEVYLNCHFEMLSILFCIISIYLNKKKYIISSSFFYGLAVHSKIYLLVLIPFFLIRNSLDSKKNKLKKFKIILFILFFSLGILFPVIVFQLLVKNNSQFGLDSLFKFTNEFEFNSLYFYLLKVLFSFETAKRIVFVLISFIILYSIFNYKKYFINFQRGLLWCYTFFVLCLLLSPIVNPWYFLIVIPLYFIAKIRMPNILLLVLLPQISYLTIVNLKIEEETYIGFYNLHESVNYFEILCITFLLIISWINRKNKLLFKSWY